MFNMMLLGLGSVGFALILLVPFMITGIVDAISGNYEMSERIGIVIGAICASGIIAAMAYIAMIG